MALKVVGKSITLYNGMKMPLLGLGCWQSSPGEVAKAVEVALDNGYRHIDTAYTYLNEEEVGNGIHSWLKKGNKREDIFVVTKLPMIGMNANSVERFMNLSLKKLNLPYVDLYLIHVPFGLKGADDTDVFGMKATGIPAVDHSTDHIAIWKEMEKLVDQGLTKSIGVSNFSVKQIRKLLAISRIPPAVNQVEAHVRFQQNELAEFCRKNNIVLTAYAPLGSPGRENTGLQFDLDRFPAAKLLQDPVVKLVADKHKVTPAQVLIRYLIQKDYVTIPKSVNPERIKSNGDVFSFTLDETDVAALLSLDLGEKGRSFLISSLPGVEDHPESTF
ncbi:UNVERIFIED_CONTAM: hypothetical protein RMT77_011208 [Armadillidium vulgare]